MNKYFSILIIAISLSSCKSEYDKYVTRELNSGIQNDSLIFNMFMGQTKKEFYTTCWDLNKNQIISQGTGNTSAKYLEPKEGLEDTLKRKELQFYGIFDDNDIMRGMELTYSYTAYAPWNTKMHSDQLMKDLVPILESTYPGNNFISVSLDDGKIEAMVKIDGNRRILMFPKSEKDLMVKIEDLEHKMNSL